MSGGEQQMLAIGRALMARPALLLLDEPSMGLAPILVDRIYETVAEINKQGVDDPAGRAERQPRARRLQPRLRAGDRQGRARTTRPRSCGRTPTSRRPTWEYDMTRLRALGRQGALPAPIWLARVGDRGLPVGAQGLRRAPRPGRGHAAERHRRDHLAARAGEAGVDVEVDGGFRGSGRAVADGPAGVKERRPLAPEGGSAQRGRTRGEGERPAALARRAADATERERGRRSRPRASTGPR